MSLLEPEIGNVASDLWFFAIEVDEFRYVERVTFSGFLDGTQVSCWEIPLDERVAAISLFEADLPEPIKIEKASVFLKKKVKKAENDG